MAEGEGMELPIPRNGGERDDVAIPIEPSVLEEVRVRRELYEDRYRLEAPTFTVKKRLSNLSKNSKRCWRLHNGRQEWLYSS